jgi:hypothetical protein
MYMYMYIRSSTLKSLGESSFSVQNVYKKGKSLDDMNALSEYIKKNFPSSVDVINNTGNMSINVDIMKKKSTILKSYENNLRNWLKMTQNGVARTSKPELRLRDGLMSLNYMIAEESLQAFDEVHICIWTYMVVCMYLWIDGWMYIYI